jgi:hypothetical protein
MTALILVTTAAITAWTVEWCQRHCETWCQARDRDL